MSTIIVAVIVLAITISIILLLVYINKKHTQQKNRRLLNSFSQAGSGHGLTFTSQEILKNRIIGLDGTQRILLVMESGKDQETFQLIDLNDVKSCKLKKQHIITKEGDGKPYEHLVSIGLQFLFSGNKDSCAIIFYDHIENHVFETGELEKKAMLWEVTLSKFLEVPASERA